MAITDLTNTKWVLNSSLNSGPQVGTINFSVNFTSNGTNYTEITLPRAGADSDLIYNSTSVYNFAHITWSSQAYRIIEITGGTDVTNSDLISWLEANAVQVNVTDLTDTKWVINENPDVLTTTSFNCLINFTSNNENFTTIENPSGLEELDYIGSSNYTVYDGIENEWSNQAYRLISITGGNDVSNPDLLVWLNNNATLVPVVDLSNTEWVINNSSLSLMLAQFEDYLINFISNNNNYTGIRTEQDPEDDHYYLIYSTQNNPWFCVFDFDTEEWLVDNAYKTIEISSGTDIANPDLIAWLSQNATYQEPVISNIYTITHSLTNLTKSNMTFVITPDQGYDLPSLSSAITVTNGTLVSYNSSTGAIVISGDDTTTISTSCPEEPHGFTVTITNAGGYHMMHNWYSLDNGATWVSLESAGSPIVLTDVTQIKFKVIYDNAYNQGSFTSATLGMNLEIPTSPSPSYDTTAESQNYILTQDVNDVMAYDHCFVEGTQIVLADRTTKNVEDITYDDNLLVYDFYEGKLTSAKPCWIMKEQSTESYKKITLSDGTIMKLVGPDEKCHRLFNVTKQQFLYANECVGDEVYTLNGIVKVLSCEIIAENVKYYNLSTEKYINCFANGVLTGSRLNNMYHISNMKYDGTERLISEAEEAERWAVRNALRK